MNRDITVEQAQIDRVLTVLQRQRKRCLLEEVTQLCHDLTDEQVVLAVDYLAQTGRVRLTLDVDRTYWVRA
ncbi:MAG: hypothetical protein A4E19_04785 [Nitrospira sp. SG-bin1]|nr:MAG: hypothetical protein A4E19_04785 [Nitrospira sp. SG-bin1]